MKKPPTIAVLGGTGKAGKYIVEQLIEHGYPIKMLVRSPEKIAAKNPLIEVVMGSARNYATLQRLLSGCDAIVSALGNSKKEPDTCSTAIAHILRITGKLKIKRYVEVAGLVIDTPSDNKGFKTRLIGKIIRALFPKAAGDRQKGYEMLTRSNLAWTIIRCPSIELTREKRKLAVSDDDSPGNKVSATDLAFFIIGQLTTEQYIRKCPFVAS